LFHGTTLHGMQSLDPAAHGEPLTYYHRRGPIGQAFASLPPAAARGHIAAVGLGVGTLATYRTPGQQWTFYEIDPEVERIARTDEYFTFMRACGDSCRVVIGDARLSLAKAPEQAYGMMILDAFSSDAIPIHLMTREALGLYLSRLAPGGVLAFHISNRHLNLAPVLGRLAASHGLAVRLQQHSDGTPGLFASWWMVMSRDEKDLGPLASDRRWVVPTIPASTPLWTDDFSNILSVLNIAAR
jgi:spermidine synthase